MAWLLEPGKNISSWGTKWMQPHKFSIVYIVLENSKSLNSSRTIVP